MKKYILFGMIGLFLALPSSLFAEYLGSWKIDDAITFTANTHSPTTGAATDADSVPSCRVYEDETGTPLLTSSMMLLDSDNTDGFYSEQITLSSASGFEKGKTYTVYISAAVGGVTGTIAHKFQIEAEVDANTVSSGVTVATNSDKTGYSLASAPPSSADIAGAVWDEARSGHTIAGSFGEGVSSVQGNVTGNVAGSVDSVTNDVNIAEIGPGVIVSTSLDASAITAIQSGLSTHSAADVVTAMEADGSKLDHLWETTEDDSGVRRFTTNALEQASGTGATAQQVWEYATRTLTANTNLNIPSAADNADAVWDEAIADHTTGTTFGGKNQRVVPSETLNDYKADVSGLATSAALATVDGNVDSILEDTNELQTNQGNWLTATGFSTHSAADVWSVATRALSGTQDSNVTSINGTPIPGTGTQLADGFQYFFDVATPSKTLNDVGVAGAGLTAEDVWAYTTRTLTSAGAGGATAQEVWEYSTRTLTSGANLTIPWNSAWDAEVQSECTDSLNAYDPPTYAEMAARTLPSDSYFDPESDILEGTLSFADAWRLQDAVLFGRTTGGGSGTLIYRDLANTKARVSIGVDANRNRTSVTLDGE